MKKKLRIGRILTSLLLTLFATTAWADEVELQNHDFSLSNPIDNHLCGYGKDMAANGTTYYGLQDIDEWTKVVVKGDNTTADYPNSGMGGAVFPYGSDYEMRGNKKTAPYGDPEGNDGNGLGFFAVWSCGGYYYQDVTLPSGKYKFSVVIFNQSGTQANTSYTGVFVKNSDTKHTVAVNPSVGSWTTETVEFVISEETECEVRVGYLSTGGGSDANPMIFIDNVKLEKVGEASEYPKDMTAYIVNPTIEGSAGWTCEKPNGGNGPLLNGSAFEYWNGTAANGAFDYYQTITGLPDGKYTVSAEMYNSTNSEADAVFSATSGVYGVAGAAEASAAVDVDGTTLTKYTTPEIAVVDSTLRIGVKNFTTMTARWFVADNFTLTQTAALTLDDYKTVLSEAITAAEALVSTIPTAAATALQTVIDQYKDASYETADEYKTAIAAVNAAVTTASAFVTPYAAWKESADIAETIGVDVFGVDGMTAEEVAAAALNNYISIYNYTTENLADSTQLLGTWTGAPGTNMSQSWDGSADDTYYDAWNMSPFEMTQTVTLPMGQYVLMVKARASEGAGINMTDGTTTVALPTKGAAGYGIETDGTPNYAADGTYANNGAGWGWEYRFLPFYSDGITPVKLTFNWDTRNAQWIGVDDIKLFRAYVDIADVEVTTDGLFNENDEVKVVVSYTPTATGVFASHYLDAVFAYELTDSIGTVVASGEKNPDDFADGTFDIFVPGLTSKTEYTLNLTGVNVYDYNLMDYETFTAPSVYSATDLDSVTFTAVKTESVTYDENENNDIVDVALANVTITREIILGYNNVVLPFSLTANQVAQTFGEGSVVYNYTEKKISDTESEITFVEGDGSITANVPVLLKATAESNEQYFEGVQIVAAESAEVEGFNFNYTGGYKPGPLSLGDYYYDSFYQDYYGGPKMSQGTEDIWANAFQAYFKDKNPSAGTKTLTITNFNVPTGIATIEKGKLNIVEGTIYNTAGQRMNKVQKGLYIINGKKVVVK